LRELYLSQGGEQLGTASSFGPPFYLRLHDTTLEKVECRSAPPIYHGPLLASISQGYFLTWVLTVPFLNNIKFDLTILWSQPFGMRSKYLSNDRISIYLTHCDV